MPPVPPKEGFDARLTGDYRLSETDEITIVIQVNGKLRARMDIQADLDAESVKAQALADENVLRFTEDKTVRKVIYVPGKLVNIVAN